MTLAAELSKPETFARSSNHAQGRRIGLECPIQPGFADGGDVAED